MCVRLLPLLALLKSPTINSTLSRNNSCDFRTAATQAQVQCHVIELTTLLIGSDFMQPTTAALDKILFAP